MKGSINPLSQEKRIYDSKLTISITPELENLKKENMSYNCSMIKKKTKKIHYLKIFDSFLAISKVIIIFMFYFLDKIVIGSLI